MNEKPSKAFVDATSSVKEKGQLSIFLGVTLLVVMTFLAFIVNVGLFVKAKINLQNAVDAAAWSGAAVQSRQLTNIGYLNWEMRNTYKEWMFKYYVLGNLAVENLRSPGPIDTAVRTNFRLQPFYKNSSDPNYDPNIYDRFNMPTICIHYGSPHNICGIAMIPGLPRFNSVGLPSISEHHESFLNSIVQEKASDCSSRTNVNFGAAMLWAYGTRTSTLFPGISEIAAHRTGAWTESIELAIRMRNLEMMVNLPPQAAPICAEAGATSGGSCEPVVNLEGKVPLPLFERPIKAFWSAFRNLGGGDSKAEGKNDDDLSRTFTLTELPPEPFETEPASLSGFLIPANAAAGGAVTALQKSYLDLQAYTLNLVTFYTTFVSDSGTFKNGGTVVGDEARCAGSKTALPVPGYILGFVKNPEVMTYYAVKGEAKHVGLFFPFGEISGIKLSAYSAAKPFGGKIGPRIFSVGPDGNTVVPRNEPSMTRTGPYVSGFNTSSLLAGGWKPIYPLPLTDTFWVTSSRHVGGTPKSGAQVYFGVPNLIYDFDSSVSEIANQNVGNVIEILQPANSRGAADNPTEFMGLNDAAQYREFRSNLNSAAGSVLSPQEIDLSLNGVRKPTRYEAMNYLIPTLGTFEEDNVDTQQVVNQISNNGDGSIRYQLFAPLAGQGTLYENIDDITSSISDYIDFNKSAVDKYLEALETVANDMRSKSGSTRSGDAYRTAANSIHKTPLNVSGAPADASCQGLSMAQIFNQFFNGISEQCGIKPLRDNIVEYFNTRAGENPDYLNFYRAPYTKPSKIDNKGLMAAYMPGPRQGAQTDGTMVRPFPSSAPAISKRNYYSTKFFALEKIISGGNFPYEQISLYLEKKDMGTPPADLFGVTIRNKLPSDEVSEFGGSSVKH